MTESERTLMQQHSAYFKTYFDSGKVLLFGPVQALEGSFGVGILEVESEEDAKAFAANDPTVKAGLNTFAIYPMHLGGAQASR